MTTQLHEQLAWENDERVETYPRGADIYPGNPSRRPGSSTLRYRSTTDAVPAVPPPSSRRPAGPQARFTDEPGTHVPKRIVRPDARFPDTDEGETHPARRAVTPARRRRSGLVVVGAALAVLSGSLLINWGGNAWHTLQDDWHYGRPRTAQYYAVVGHNHDSNAHPSHFIALNLHGDILVFEVQAGDPAKTKVYTGPTLIGPDVDLVPATLDIRDVTADHRPDLVITAGSLQFVLVNDPDGFRPARPGEVSLEK